MQFLEVLSWRQFYCPSLWCSGWSVPTVSKIVHELLEIMQQPCSATAWDWGQHPGFLATVSWCLGFSQHLIVALTSDSGSEVPAPVVMKKRHYQLSRHTTDVLCCHLQNNVWYEVDCSASGEEVELQRQMFARCKELEQVIKFQRETIQDQVGAS